MLVIPTQVTEVHVGLTAEELSNIQIKDQEKQRVIGIIPNFYVSYTPNAAPLAPKLKFELAWKTAVDPVSLLGVGIVAGFDQAGDRWGAYGQGAQGCKTVRSHLCGRFLRHIHRGRHTTFAFETRSTLFLQRKG
jgi:hypothetical protein